jgi:hypothetical protein
MLHRANSHFVIDSQVLFTFIFPIKILYAFLIFSKRFAFPNHLILLYLKRALFPKRSVRKKNKAVVNARNNDHVPSNAASEPFGRSLKVVKPHIMHFFSYSSHFLCPRSKRCPQHAVLKHPQSTFSLNVTDLFIRTYKTIH